MRSKGDSAVNIPPPHPPRPPTADGDITVHSTPQRGRGRGGEGGVSVRNTGQDPSRKNNYVPRTRFEACTSPACWQIDPPFEHFKNLTDLDLGRNRLKCLGNLPAGLVFLSCAANDLHGEPSAVSRAYNIP